MIDLIPHYAYPQLSLSAKTFSMNASGFQPPANFLNAANPDKQYEEGRNGAFSSNKGVVNSYDDD
jgi:hypothetical protein